LSLTEFQNFPGPVALFQDFPVLENAAIKFQDFPGFPGPVRTLCCCCCFTAIRVIAALAYIPHEKVHVSCRERDTGLLTQDLKRLIGTSLTAIPPSLCKGDFVEKKGKENSVNTLKKFI